mgnify:FL=1
MKKDDLGNRMKENYENRTKQFLPRRTNTLIRLDGKAFHTYTKGFDKPFDDVLINTMNETTKFLCENIQGCIFGYTQSDEITLVLQDYNKLTSDAWFDGNIQKITSVSASMATAKFNELIPSNNLALFDSRVFTIPENMEVINCIIWRQQDSIRNSISMVAQSLYSHKELHGKSSNEMQEMIFQKGQNWNDLDVGKKRGRMILKDETMKGVDKKVAESLIEKKDSRLVEIDGEYYMKIIGWKILDSIDFNKDKSLLNRYLFENRNYSLSKKYEIASKQGVYS